MARPVLVFIDTNVAIQDNYFFFKKQGVELLNAIRRAGARLVVPEILRQEYLDNFVVVSRQARSALDRGTSMSQPFFDLPLGQFFPSADEVRNRGRRILEGLDDVITFIPETDALLLATSRRVKAKLAPCSKTDHGFKDCLIWESILSVADDCEVHIVTKDKAFFQDDSSDLLASSMLAESHSKGITVHGYGERKPSGDAMSLTGVIKAIMAHVPAPDPNALNIVDGSNSGTPSAPTAPPAGDDVANRPEIQGDDRAPTSGAPEVASSPEQGALAVLLEPMRAEFWKLDGKVLGVIAYLGGHDKDRLYGVLDQMGIDDAHARNVCDRLALSGLIKDTGHNLLPVPGRASELAAALVENEIIELMLRDR